MSLPWLLHYVKFYCATKLTLEIFFPSWLGRSKRPCCKRGCGQNHMVRNCGWPLGAEGDQQPARNRGPTPAAPQPREINRQTTRVSLEVDSFPVKPADENAAQLTMIAALWDSPGRTQTPDPRGREKTREHKQGERQKEREKQAPCSGWSPTWVSIPGPQGSVTWA